MCLLTRAGEGSEVVASLAIEEAGVSKPPHVLGLDLCTVETTLHQHPHKEREEVCGEEGVGWRREGEEERRRRRGGGGEREGERGYDYSVNQHRTVQETTYHLHQGHSWASLDA